MKKVFVLFILLMAFGSCEKEEATPTAPINDSFDPATSTLVKSGAFSGASGYSVSGTATVYDNSGKKTVLLDPFTSQNGPDLKVYLSTDQNASKYINLGAMKSTNGKQSYEVPGDSDLTEYKFVLIWCQQFSVLFGKAELN